ncbi:MAG TPA: TauD/TfdA family dioxygenase [Orrella sp.]
MPTAIADPVRESNSSSDTLSDTLSFTPLHSTFMARASDIDLRTVTDEPTLAAIRAGMAQYGVLVFRGQQFTGQEQVAFAQRLDGELHRKTSSAVIAKNRYGDEALTDISNVDGDGSILTAEDRRRINGISNRIWHTDASFESPAGRYSMLYARTIPPVRADTEFADMRTAYEKLDDETKTLIDGLHAHHSIVYSRHIMGFDFSPEEAARLPGAVHPLVRRFKESPRPSLYLASHANRIMEWRVPEGRLLLKDLMEHAIQREFVHFHEWTKGDLVIWDNRMTMHRARPYDDVKYKRELTRVTTLDIERVH